MSSEEMEVAHQDGRLAALLGGMGHTVEVLVAEAMVAPPDGLETRPAGRNIAVAEGVWNALKHRAQPPAVLIFAERGGAGLRAVQARQSGLGLATTRIISVLHGPGFLRRQTSAGTMRKIDEELRTGAMEQLSVEGADAVVTPSQWLADQLLDAGWVLPGKRVLAGPGDWPGVPTTPAEGTPLPVCYHTLVFAGPLDSGGGLGLFVRALQVLGRQHPGEWAGVEIRMVGPAGFGLEGSARTFLESQLGPAGESWQWQISPAEGSGIGEAIRAIRSPLVVVPRLDGLVPEWLADCPGVLPLRVGGMVEYFDPAALPLPDAAALAARIAAIYRGQAGLPERRQQPGAAAQWQALLEDITVTLPARPPRGAGPQVAVCIPFYNLGAWLPEALASIADQTMADCEVVCVDDGSPEKESRRIFDECAARYAGRGWKFDRIQNRGLEGARMHAVSLSTAPWLLFFDPDNIALPAMAEKMLGAAETSGAAAVTIYLELFQEDLPEGKPCGWLRPVGAESLSLLVENTIGDANFLVSRTVFLERGGFRPFWLAGCEDFEFLCGLHAAGYRVQVLPEVLARYRMRGGSMSQNMPPVPTQHRGIRALTGRGGMTASLLDLLHSLLRQRQEMKERLREKEIKIQRLNDKLARRDQKPATAARLPWFQRWFRSARKRR